MKKTAILFVSFVSGWALADINITPGNGTKVVHTDSVNGVEYQAVKIIDGSTGGTSSATVTTNGGLHIANAQDQLLVTTTGTVKVDGSAVTQPVSGAVNSWAINGSTTATQPVSVATPYQVFTSSFGVNGSSITSFQGGLWSITNTGFNVNNTPAVTQSGGPWTVTNGNSQLLTTSTGTQTVSGSVNAWVINGSTTGTQPVTLSGNPAVSNPGNAFLVTSTGTQSVQNISGQLIIQSTMSLPITGSITSNSVNLSTSQWNQVLTGTGTIIGGVGPTGNAQAFAVGAASETLVGNSTRQLLMTSTGTFLVSNGSNQLLVTSTGTQTVSGTVTANAGTGNFTVLNAANQLLVTSTGTQSVQNISGQLIIQSTMSLPISGAITANTVNLSTVDWNQAIGSTGTMIAAVGPTGNAQAFRVNLASAVFTTTSIDGSSNTVVANAGTGNFTVLNANNQLLVTSTGTQTVSGTVTANAGTGNFTVLNANNQLLVTSTGTQTVSGTITANAGTGNFTVLNANNQLLVTSTGTFNVQNPGNAMLVTSTNTAVLSTVTVQGNANIGVAPTGNPMQNGVEVASTTLPTTRADGTMIYAMGTTIGQLATVGVPYGLITTTLTANLWNSNQVLFSSPTTATQFTYLCGCEFGNTSATADNVTITAVGGFLTTADQEVVAVPAGDTRGHWPGCANPLMRSRAGSNILISGSATVTSLAEHCQAYVGP